MDNYSWNYVFQSRIVFGWLSTTSTRPRCLLSRSNTVGQIWGHNWYCWNENCSLLRRLDKFGTRLSRLALPDSSRSSARNSRAYVREDGLWCLRWRGEVLGRNSRKNWTLIPGIQKDVLRDIQALLITKQVGWRCVSIQKPKLVKPLGNRPNKANSLWASSRPA